MSAITPELALIDPELAAAARALLPEPGAFRPAWSVRSEGGTAPGLELLLPVTPEPVHRSSRRSSRRAVFALVGVLPVVATALALTMTQWAPEVTGPDATAEGAAPSPMAALQTGAGRTYAWPDVPGARTYHVAVLRDRQPFFETTTTKPTLELPTALELPPGRYTLSATPQSESSSSEPAARPVIEETFVVEPQ
jgi:hypothetical protein